MSWEIRDQMSSVNGYIHRVPHVIGRWFVPSLICAILMVWSRFIAVLVPGSYRHCFATTLIARVCSEIPSNLQRLVDTTTKLLYTSLWWSAYQKHSWRKISETARDRWNRLLASWCINLFIAKNTKWYSWKQALIKQHFGLVLNVAIYTYTLAQ